MSNESNNLQDVILEVRTKLDRIQMAAESLSEKQEAIIGLLSAFILKTFN